MARALWLLDYLTEDGLNPAWVPGWEKRGRDGLDAEVVLGHHIGISGGGVAPGLGIVTNGHGKLRGNALCNVHGARSGRPTVVAAGVAWHAGLGGFAGFTGNRRALGIEAEGTTGEWMSDRQYDGYIRTATSLLRGLRREEGRFATHHDWRFEKPDAWALVHTRGGVNAFRSAIRTRLHPPVQEDDMERRYEVVEVPTVWNGRQSVAVPGYQFEKTGAVTIKANDGGPPVMATVQPWSYAGALMLTFVGLNGEAVPPGRVGVIIGYQP